MKHYRSRQLIRPAVFTALLAGFLSSPVGTSIQAQQNPQSGIPPRERNLLERELNITLLEKGLPRTIEREPALLLKQINEDFSGLQLVNNQLKLRISANGTLDFKHISDAATEIKKRSKRLRTNLVFPESGKHENLASGQDHPDTDLKTSLVTLGRLIRSFVTNRVFQDAGVIDAALAAKARGDLDDIIVLSDKIKKHAEKLKKPGKLQR